MAKRTTIATPDEPAKARAHQEPVVSRCEGCGSHLGRMLAADVSCPKAKR